MTDINKTENILIDPKVVLQPVNFALHLAVFGNVDKPIHVPLGWLWEELVKEYSICTLSDILYWHTDDIDKNLAEPLVSDNFLSLHATSALISAAKKLGYIQFIATKDYGRFFRTDSIDNWSGYLVDLIGGDWIDIESSKRSRDFAEGTTLDIVSKRRGLGKEELSTIYRQNLSWINRKPEDYPIFEEIRVLKNTINQLCSCLEHGFSLSTANTQWHTLLRKELRAEGIVRLPQDHCSSLPILRLVKNFPMNFTVSDVIKMIESRELLEKLGVTADLLESIENSHKKKELIKGYLLYLIGIVPGAGSIANVLGALDLLNQASALFKDNDSLKSLLYSEVTEWTFPGMAKNNYDGCK